MLRDVFAQCSCASVDRLKNVLFGVSFGVACVSIGASCDPIGTFCVSNRRFPRDLFLCFYRCTLGLSIRLCRPIGVSVRASSGVLWGTTYVSAEEVSGSIGESLSTLFEMASGAAVERLGWLLYQINKHCSKY